MYVNVIIRIYHLVQKQEISSSADQNPTSTCFTSRPQISTVSSVDAVDNMLLI